MNHHFNSYVTNYQRVMRKSSNDGIVDAFVPFQSRTSAESWCDQAFRPYTWSQPPQTEEMFVAHYCISFIYQWVIVLLFVFFCSISFLFHYLLRFIYKYIYIVVIFILHSNPRKTTKVGNVWLWTYVRSMTEPPSRNHFAMLFEVFRMIFYMYILYYMMLYYLF